MHIAQALRAATAPATPDPANTLAPFDPLAPLAPLTRLEAQMLLLHALGRATDDRAWLLSHDQDLLSAATQALFASHCLRRRQGEPVAYITGHKAFYGLDLQIDARVLDPRPDTETLVDWALALLQGRPSPSVLDLGTGSGAIALALAHARPDARVHALDLSADALAVAQANAQRLGLAVRFAPGNWFESTAPWAGQQFDLIVSNPPYIADQDPHLVALQHEPLEALTAGPEGLDDLKTIISGATSRLSTGSWLLLEHGYDQSAAVQALLRQAGFQAVTSHADLSGIARCSGGQWPDTFA